MLLPARPPLAPVIHGGVDRRAPVGCDRAAVTCPRGLPAADNAVALAPWLPTKRGERHACCTLMHGARVRGRRHARVVDTSARVGALAWRCRRGGGRARHTGTGGLTERVCNQVQTSLLNPGHYLLPAAVLVVHVHPQQVGVDHDHAKERDLDAVKSIGGVEGLLHGKVMFAAAVVRVDVWLRVRAQVDDLGGAPARLDAVTPLRAGGAGEGLDAHRLPPHHARGPA
mmetsp:Transcript_15449/g.47042  ORF Transcript_15449/g.47042 Transcript_15449/m.47042 type:complete len:227 (+) Transcript_15449:329-1009(+)